MLVTLDLVSAHRPRAARLLLAYARAASPIGGELLPCFHTAIGAALQAPWRSPAPPTLLGLLTRRDGWGALADPRRVLLVGAWESDSAIEQFQAYAPWPARAERWHARLRPVRSTGTIFGSDPLHGTGAGSRAEDAPGVVLTYVRHPLQGARTFRQHRGKSIQLQQRSSGALASFSAMAPTSKGFPKARAYGFHGYTVTCWRRLGDAVAFAYRGEAHRAAIEWMDESVRLGAEYWFARLALERSDGTLAGRDPFAGIARAQARAVDEC